MARRASDRYLKWPEEVARLFAGWPEVEARSVEIAERRGFSLDELQCQYPAESCVLGLTTQEALTKLTWEGATERYLDGVPDKLV
jgi:error-prone DNA polymerase